MQAVARRRTQEERSAATRARLLDATLECLAELGYARTTTTEIAERGGVSRGAQLHHFPPDAERPPPAVDLLWSMVAGPTFHAWLELVVAARTDEQLKPKVTALTARF